MFLFFSDFSDPESATSIFCRILSHLGEVIGSKRIYIFWEVKDSAEGFYKYYHVSSTNLTILNRI